MTATKTDDKVRDISDLFEVFGKYQVLQYVKICLPAVFITMININYIFVAGDLHYRCRVQECEGTDSTVHYPLWWPNSTIDRCSRPVVRQDLEQETCTNTSFTGKMTECTEWVYESNNTVVAELNLACQPWKINLIGTVHNMGMLVSMVVSGWKSDRFGRKPTLIFCVVAGCIGQVKTCASSYYVYLFVEFLEAALTGGSYAAAMVLLIETSGKKYRILSGVLFACSIYVGESMFACIAMFVPYWKTLIHIINGPSIFFLSYIFLVYESPRWQIVRGHIENAKKTMKSIATINNIKIDLDALAKLDEKNLKEKLNIIEHEVKESYIDIFTSKEILKRLLVAAVCRFTSSFVYYGLMINSVWLPGDKYMNFFLSTVMSFPGEMISLYLMNRVGRKLPLMVGYMIAGVMCVASAYVPASFIWTKIAAFLISKVVIAACFTGAITYCMELFPTSARGSLLGLGAFASRLGGMLAPLTPILNTVSPVLPTIFFGCSAVLAGSLISLTPETRDLPLMDTIRQIEEFAKKKRADRNTEVQSVGNSMDTIVSTA